MRLTQRRPPRKQADNEPPEWALALGGAGLLVNIMARAVGGTVGSTLADLGCATTMTGAVVFFALVIRWCYPGKRRG